MRRRRLPRITAIVGLIWLLAGIPSGSSAQEAPPFSAYRIGTFGSGVSMTYVDPNSPIPASPTGEMHAAYSLATLDFGPTGHGVAAELWPGETAATASPFIEQSFWDGLRDGYKQFQKEWSENGGQGFPEELPEEANNPRLAPRWPAAAETFEPGGPNEDAVSPNARSTAQGAYVSSSSNTVPIELPGVFRSHSGASSSLATLDDIPLEDGRRVPGAISEARAWAGRIDILGGFITIEKVTTRARAVSDAEAAQVSGSSVVSGLKIEGRGFEIDYDGIHAEGETHDDFNPVLSQIREGGETALAEQGITMTLAKPIDTVQGVEGARSLGGLVVRIDSRRLDEAVGNLPDELEEQVRAQVSTDHTLTLVFGSVGVSASAAPEFTFDESSFDFGGAASPPSQVLSSGTGSPSAVLNSSPLPQVTPAPSGGFAPVQPAFAAPVEVDGVGAGTALVAIALVLAAARGLHAMSGALLAGGAGADCTT